MKSYNLRKIGFISLALIFALMMVFYYEIKDSRNVLAIEYRTDQSLFATLTRKDTNRDILEGIYSYDRDGDFAGLNVVQMGFENCPGGGMRWVVGKEYFQVVANLRTGEISQRLGPTEFSEYVHRRKLHFDLSDKKRPIATSVNRESCHVEWK